MSQFNIARRAGRHGLWIVLLWSLIACSTTPESEKDFQPSAALTEQVRQLEAAGDYQAVAALYLGLEGSPRQLREWRLRAAEAYLRGGEPRQASETALSLDKGSLNLDQRGRYEVVLARTELALNGPAAAAARSRRRSRRTSASSTSCSPPPGVSTCARVIPTAA